MFEQERTLTRLQQRISSEGGLLAAFLTGSWGRRTEDRYSDIDVVLVYLSEASKALNSRQWPELVAGILPYVEATIRPDEKDPDHLIALYANGSKFDFYFKSKEELAPHPRFHRIRILKDTNGWAQDLADRSAGVSVVNAHTMSEKEMAAIDRRFWTDFWEIYRLTLRGEVARPFPIFVGLAAAAIPPLLAVLPADHPAAQNLIGLDFSQEAGRNLTMLQNFAAFYREARSAVIERHRLSYRPNQAVEAELLRLMRR